MVLELRTMQSVPIVVSAINQLAGSSFFLLLIIRSSSPSLQTILYLEVLTKTAVLDVPGFFSLWFLRKLQKIKRALHVTINIHSILVS